MNNGLGPFQNLITSLAVNGKAVLAGTASGVCISTDDGSNWSTLAAINLSSPPADVANESRPGYIHLLTAQAKGLQAHDFQARPRRIRAVVRALTRQPRRVRPGANEVRQAGDAGQGDPRLFAAGNFDAEVLLDLHHELERIDRIEGEARSHERIVVLDAVGGDALQVERFHDHVFETDVEWVGHTGIAGN